MLSRQKLPIFASSIEKITYFDTHLLTKLPIGD